MQKIWMLFKILLEKKKYIIKKMDSNNYFSVGSEFMSGTTATIIGSFSNLRVKDEIGEVAQKIRILLKSERELTLEVIVEKLNVRAEIALQALKMLRDKGLIKYDNE